ncbi:MAG: hypothetical protein UT43_C0043G0008 [Parcubacteria group bacterium GW2011_GWC1_39_29]|nr:MAG: hypothetical protein UT43_C0043G0008 [Parcubacteria group bacterium GW2011_GWC1_39_29]
MNKKNIILVMVIVVVGIAGFYIYRIKEQPVTNVVTYYCEEGTIAANYGKNEVSLSLKDGRKFTLPQAISGSGIRYELGVTTFSSKGDNAFLTENNVNTYNNCVSGTQTSANSINTYTDTSKTFSFNYPDQFVLSGGEMGYSQNWRSGTTDLGMILSVVHIPRSFIPSTNFSEAKFTVGTSADSNAVKNCLIADGGNGVITGEATIGGRKFTKLNFTDAGAGNYYETTSYRMLYNNQCYAVEYTIHSTNIYNYSPDQDIKEFDKAKITSILEAIVQSFKTI